MACAFSYSTQVVAHTIEGIVSFAKKINISIIAYIDHILAAYLRILYRSHESFTHQKL